MEPIYMIDEVIDSFRWVGLAEESQEIGIELSKIKFNPVNDILPPIKIEWLPETKGREICDFPNFRSQFTCMSDKAFKCLNQITQSAGEFINLYGLDVEYRAFHCLTVYDALDKEWVEKMQKEDKYFSIANPSSVISLVFDKIGSSNIFHIAEVKNRFFVRKLFKDICDSNALTGLSFRAIPLR